MATVTMTIPDDTLAALTQAVCFNFNYSVNGGVLSSGDFVTSQLIGWGEGQIATYIQAQANLAAQQAQQAALAAAAAAAPTSTGITIAVS